ncbi:MAG: type II toxin-antitoxin system HicA family toxin [Bacteroidaceae bacterium]
MPKIKNLSGKEVIKILESFDFIVSRQKGSHVILKRTVSDNNQIILVPNHTTIDRGTLHSIYKKLLLYIDESELRQYFYTE